MCSIRCGGNEHICNNKNVLIIDVLYIFVIFMSSVWKYTIKNEISTLK